MSGEWKYYYNSNRDDFMDNMYHHINSGESHITKTRRDGTHKKISPFAVLISKDGNILHWVTVTDIYGYNPRGGFDAYENSECLVSYNEFGRQSTDSCKEFVTWAKQVDDSLLMSGYPEYITVKFEPSLINTVLNQVRAIRKN
jgi:hypothetical protein